MSKQLEDKLTHAKREAKALRRKLDAMKTAPVPQGGSEEYQQGVADAVMAIWRAMDDA